MTRSNNKNNHKITEEKLLRADYYRAQIQMPYIEYKILIASVYNFIAEHYPKNAIAIRDSQAKEVIKVLIHDFKTMVNGKPAIVDELNNWLVVNVPDKKLLKLVHSVLDKYTDIYKK